MASNSLKGLCIAVTRPRDQAAQLARMIEQAGGIPLMFPLLEIAPVSDIRILHEQLAGLPCYNLAIFISPNAVRYGMEAIRAAGDIPPTLKIAAVGQGSAKVLRELGINNAIAPTERYDSEGLLAMPELQDVSGWKVMIFRGEDGRELLGDTLRMRGATVEYAACYQRSKPRQDVNELVKSKPDAITVTSSEALGYLWQMLDAGQALSILANTALFAPHERIAALARTQGWKMVLNAQSGDSGMMTALLEWAAGRQLGVSGG